MNTSKEDILEGYESVNVNTDYDFFEKAWVKGSVEQAMEEYAKQKAIEFANWKDENFKPVLGGWQHNLGDLVYKGLYSNETLYELFEKSTF